MSKKTEKPVIEDYQKWVAERQELSVSLAKLSQLRAMELDKTSKPVRIRTVIYDVLHKYCEITGKNMSQVVTLAVIDALMPEIESRIKDMDKLEEEIEYEMGIASVNAMLPTKE